MASNHSALLAFHLIGLSEFTEHDVTLFLIFLFMYIMTILGNGGLLVLVLTDPRLHTPMYLFLLHLSVVDISFISVTVPQLLINFLYQSNRISVGGCFTQVFFFHWVGSLECLLLSVMAYDRYLAVCVPLHYVTLMTKGFCARMLVLCWTVSFLNSLLHTLLASRLSYCGPNVIQNFFCDLPPLLELSCSVTSINKLVILTEGLMMVMGPFVFILMSYVLIILSITKLSSFQDRWKVFSACISHISVVVLFYGTVMSMYFRPTTVYSMEDDHIVSVTYAVVTPMLNIYIYSLRNQDVKRSFQSVMHRLKRQYI